MKLADLFDKRLPWYWRLTFLPVMLVLIYALFGIGMSIAAMSALFSELFPARCPACHRKTIKNSIFVPYDDEDDDAPAYHLVYCKLCKQHYRVFEDRSWSIEPPA
jgi:hypothetical protein